MTTKRVLRDRSTVGSLFSQFASHGEHVRWACSHELPVIPAKSYAIELARRADQSVQEAGRHLSNIF